jgi:Mlc titration factor MtfA (ptsG expression regulator)
LILRRHGLPDDWETIVTEHVAIWDALDGDEQAMLEGNADWLLRHKYWEAAQGFTLTDEIRVTLAMQAAVPILGLDVDEYREVSAIIVYPSAMLSRGVYAGPAAGTVTDGATPILGEAHDRRGPVIIAWDEAINSSRHPGSGHNVVYHEFAHKIDMLDGVVDGTPPLERDEQRRRWVEVCTAEFEALRAGTDDGFLDGYAAVSPGEFFAVVTESFFDVPIRFEAAKPDLYAVLRDFYRQDPAAVARAATDAEN